MQDEEDRQEDVRPEVDSAEAFASVIVISRADDVAAICGQIDAAPTFAVVLHAPKGNRELTTELGMRRLLRHAEESGHSLAVATRSRGLVSRAVGSGLPVARRPQDVRWDAPGRRVVRLGPVSLALPSLGPWPGILAIAIGFGLILGLGLFVAPSAAVVVVLEGDVVSLDTEIVVLEGSATADTPAGRLLGRQVTHRERVLIAVPASGQAEFPSKRANVAVTVTAPAAGIAIPAGAVLLAGDVRFRLDQPLDLGPGETRSAAATAVIAGPAGNVAAGAVSAWEDAAHSAATVQNPAPAVNGSSELRTVITEDDVKTAEARAVALEQSSGIKGLLAAARPHELVVTETISVEVGDSEMLVPVGEPAELVLLEVSLLIRGLAVPADLLDEYAGSVLAESGQVLLPGSVSVSQLEPAQTGNAAGAFVRVRVVGRVVPSLNPAEIRDAVKGKSPAGAKEALLTRYRMDDVEIRLKPGWAPFIPRFGGRIDVELRGAGGEPIEPTPGS